MKKIYVLAIILMSISFSAKLFAQEKSAPAANNPALMEAALKAFQKSKQSSEESAQKSGTASSYYNPIDVNDEYMGKKLEFLKMITLSELPNDFPKYQQTMSFVDYDRLVEQYLKEHKNILKEAYKAKF